MVGGGVQGRDKTEADKDAMFKAMSEKLGRGEELSENELKVLKLLKEGSEEGGNLKFNPRGAKNVRQYKKFDDDGERGGKFYNSRRSPPIPQGRPLNQKVGLPAGGRRAPGYNPNAGRGGMDSDPGGMRLRRGGGEKQQLPELAEQEEVKELQLEEQEPAVERKREGEGEGEGDQGMDEQAFDPEERERKEKEEEEGRDYGGEQVQEKPVENLNLPVPGGGGQNGGQQPMPHPHR